MERALNALYSEELEELIKGLGQPAYRARQIFHYFHAEKQADLSNAQTLPVSLRRELEKYPIRSAEIARVFYSQDGSRKYLFRMFDGSVIETVFMPYEDRNTICISSEVGCLMGCTFCASTKASFVRRLQAEEILAQIYLVEKDTNLRIDNIVLMGIGEPLDNYDEVLRFIRLVTSPMGKNLSARAITLSTSGLVPGIYRLAEEKIPINLAISLHATTDALRQRTMPIARKYSIREIFAASQYYFEQTGRRVSFEYVLIHGENDTIEDQKRLVSLLKGPQFHINLIPLNEIREYQGKAAGMNRLKLFEHQLNQQGVHTTIRNKRGEDIDAACGQLRILYEQTGGSE